MEVTLLKEKQIFWENRLKIFDEYGTKAAITDFAILLGGYVNNAYYCNLLEERAGGYWTSSYNKDNDACVVNDIGYRNYRTVSARTGGVRPALPYSVISRSCTNVVKGHDGILEVEYGEYPQKAVSKILQEELECKYNQNSIKKTGKTYTTDSRSYTEKDKNFSSQEYEEFEYEGKKYVRVKTNSSYGGLKFALSNGERYKDGDCVWVEVSPIKWLVDIEKDIALSERILFAGVQFDDKEEYDGNFKETFMYKYLNTIFIKDIQVQSKEIEISVIEEKSKIELDLEKLEKDKQKILSLRKSLGK